MNLDKLGSVTVDQFMDQLLDPILDLIELDEKKFYYTVAKLYEKPQDDYLIHGSKYTLETLAKYGTRISLLPVQLQADFSDRFTQQNFDKFTSKNISEFEFCRYDYYNATTIGNLAYIFLNTKDVLVRNKVETFLRKMIRYQIELSGLIGFFKTSRTTFVRSKLS
ncbi:hypothetical protein [Flavobacterium capsici]|uniref:Uncharacterized protein n=1 Tax=Flavobacterium capsici TaxID=3075618 RepID=A0AA96J6W1_9FLAO|nr:MULTISPECIES: hypothetical protein [unclassified Flavobacterium]WNM19252.1 hypothetical protein RN608_00885 [Flavobacterium sp. PMR2A8]WNM20641.1 hypothetical protein RN605_08055 [Flavobacterium sp. PMTSA4]